MSIDQNRVFHYAIVTSIVLHAFVLFGISPRERAYVTQPERPISARLVEPAAQMPRAPAPSVIPPGVRAPRAAPAKPRPKPKLEAAKPVEKVEPPPQPYTEPEPPAAAGIPPAAEPVPPPQVARADPAPPPEPAPDPLALAKYRMQINGAAARHKHYPRVARENNWEGRVALRMVFGPGGHLASLNVIKTSGYDVLDKQASEMFRNAAQAVPVPPLLRGKDFSVDVAVAYNLTD